MKRFSDDSPVAWERAASYLRRQPSAPNDVVAEHARCSVSTVQRTRRRLKEWREQLGPLWHAHALPLHGFQTRRTKH